MNLPVYFVLGILKLQKDCEDGGKTKENNQLIQQSTSIPSNVIASNLKNRVTYHWRTVQSTNFQ